MPCVRRWLVAVFFAAVAGISATTAAVRYVDPAAPGPERNGASWATAYATISAALNDSAAGDEVRVADGYYAEALTLREAVAVRGGYPGGKDAGGPRNPRRHLSVLVGDVLEVAVYVPAGITAATVLEGFEFRTEAAYGVYCVNASPVIANNTFHQGRTAVNCGAGGAPTIANNRFLWCDYGVFSGNAAPVIAGNLFLGNLTAARHAEGGGAFVNNTVVWNIAGLSLTRSLMSVVNNVFAWNGTAVRVNASTPSLRCNVAFENDADYSGMADPAGQDGNLRADPRFAGPDGDDYRLAADSPCRDAGDNTAVVTETDLDGLPRVRNGRVDMGAYEFTPVASPLIAECLRVWGGLDAAPANRMPALDVEAAPPSQGVVDILDALRHTRP